VSVLRVIYTSKLASGADLAFLEFTINFSFQDQIEHLLPNQITFCEQKYFVLLNHKSEVASKESPNIIPYTLVNIQKQNIQRELQGHKDVMSE